MSDTNYSVLMSVYYKEKAEYLRESMDSIYNQTVPTNDFVLVCDGPLNEELDNIIAQMQDKFGDVLNVVRLEKNVGLGNALNEGLKHCKNELVARMDSDDISCNDRCEKQIEIFSKEDDVGIVSGSIIEFEGNIAHVIGERVVPTSKESIRRFSRKRNPFNHVAVMFKKEEVFSAGGYNEEYHLFEDYYLWVRMLKKGTVGLNVSSVLVYVRTSTDMYMRRGGVEYARDLMRFHTWLLNCNWSSFIDYLSGAIPHAIVCVLPNFVRKFIYLCIRK